MKGKKTIALIVMKYLNNCLIWKLPSYFVFVFYDKRNKFFDIVFVVCKQTIKSGDALFYGDNLCDA